METPTPSVGPPCRGGNFAGVRMLILPAAFLVGLLEWILCSRWQRAMERREAPMASLFAVLSVLISSIQIVAIVDHRYELLVAYIMGTALGAYLGCRR